MFTELLPLVKDRTLMLIIARTGGETLRVNVIPQRKCAEENDAAENAITSPLTITGTAEELDREFAKQIAAFRGSLDRLKSNLGEIESAHAVALKAIEEERKKELNSKRKTTGPPVKPAPRNEAESTPAGNGKVVFGGKPQFATGPTTQSLFDPAPAAAEQPVASQPENSPQAKVDALGTATEPTTSPHPPAVVPNLAADVDTRATAAELTCGICHGLILPSQQRHSLMPFAAHASATDCEASRRSAANPAR
jgi:PRTRC genetic system protein E